MRTLGFRSHVLLAVAAAIGVIAALARPWYAAAPETADSELALAAGVTRWIGESAGTPGWDALGSWAAVLAGLAVLTAAGALGCLVGALQGAAREPLRYSSLAMFAIALWKLIDTPGPNAAMEPRYGAFVAVAAALIAVTSASAVASAPLRRRRDAAVYA